MAALCWVFSSVQRKDRPSYGTALTGFPTEGAGRLPGKPERNAVPRKGDNMALARAGKGFQPSAYIFIVHTAAPSKGAAAFFYSTNFYKFPNQIREGSRHGAGKHSYSHACGILVYTYAEIQLRQRDKDIRDKDGRGVGGMDPAAFACVPGAGCRERDLHHYLRHVQR